MHSSCGQQKWCRYVQHCSQTGAPALRQVWRIARHESTSLSRGYWEDPALSVFTRFPRARYPCYPVALRPTVAVAGQQAQYRLLNPLVCSFDH